ncbi:laminin subunit alpha-4 isoform X1 [Salmo salar]|uniref:Laminin subunit alpha-4 isoform X1 n=2 Tax=Salmo salar TaxID=8030 RepID=A0A1S3M9H3_SALSA|nr:laminin subunit alpha-4 isoform X1 [Salmo salar]
MSATKALPCLCLLLSIVLSGIVYPATSIGLHWEQQSVMKVCAQRYFLSNQKKCLPCNCKGHSETCEDITGVCTSCQDHTTGDFCEICEDGYMTDVSNHGHHSCQPCACPLSSPSNNFAEHCDRSSNILRCNCQEGYAGHYCERCAPGFYGNPMVIGDSCKSCDCNGNSDPNHIFNECHNVTGFCQNCWEDTAGANCERCAPGFYGDAISAKNCRVCECSKCGTTSCDDRTGTCHCKPGVTGRLCDQCEEGHTGFNNCQGCHSCDCGPAGLRPTCHPLTHSCQCKPGAGGRYCERCLPDHWNYGPSGCQKCDCASSHCDVHTGECLPESYTVNLCNISCDECIWHLIGDLRPSNKTLDQIKVSVLNISTGAAANDRLKYYNYTAQRLKTQFVNWRNKSALMRTQTGQLEEVSAVLLLDMNHLAETESVVKSLGDRVDDDTLQSVTLADELTTNLTALNVLIEEMISDWELYSVHQELDPDIIRQKTAVAEGMVAWMKKLDLSPQEPIATDESTEAHDLLRRMRQLEKKLISTDSRVAPVREVLSRFTNKLSEAQEILQKAANTVEETEDMNKANTVKFQRSEAKQHELIENYEAVNDTLQMAKDLIMDTENTVAEMHLLVQNVTEYHAVIDGASKGLQEKTEVLPQADRDLVLRAQDHAEDLQSQADELEYNLKRSDANGFVQKALDTANVYNNIVQYIEEANITGLTTMDLATRAEDARDGINTQLGFLKTQSENVFKESVSLHSEQFEVEAEVLDKMKYIEETKETMEDYTKKLVVVLKDIKGIEPGRTTKRLELTREVAEGTLNRSVEVLQTITPIHGKVEEWATNMKNQDYSAAAFDRAVVSAGEAVENLSELVPELLDKLRVVEEKNPVNNVTTNIMRIRELIAQARSVAKKVQVSMKFSGQSSVQVQPHTNLEDLKIVTTISLFIRVDPDKDPIEDRFIFYLGDRNGRKDYMGLAIKNDNLVYVYNLGEEDVEIPLGSKPVSQWPPVFNLIKVERLGRHGKVFLTVPSQASTDEQKFIQKGEAFGTDSLFDLDPEDTVFFVGGVPADVRLPPALSLAPFVGCIELASLNNDVISMYNFKQTHKMDVVASTPCPRYKLAFSQSRIASYLFDGTGYALINNMERRGKFGIVTRFDIAVRTVANNGILLLMVNGDNFFLLELKNGFLRLMYDFGFSGGPIVMESNSPKLQINDARYHEVSVIYHYSKKLILLVDKSHVKSMENEKKTLPFSDIYIGGAPLHILLSRPDLSSLVGLKGCVKGFQFQKKDFNLLEEPGTIGISSGCPEEYFMSRKAYFTGESYLGSAAKISPFDTFEGGLNFRTLQPTGLLFYHSEGSDEFTITLENGAVVLNSRGTRVKSQKKQYNDGITHFLVASVNNDKYELVVDDKDKHEKKRPTTAPSASTVRNFYFGGSPSSSSSIKNFTGCISYAYISRQDRDIEPEDFQKYTENVQTSLQDCPVKRPSAALFSKQSKNSAKPKKGHTRKVGRDKSNLPKGLLGLNSDDQEPRETEETPCYRSPRPRATRHAHHYGGTANSRQEFTDIPGSLSERSHFSLSLKTQSSFGLIFYASDEAEDNFMALFLAHGKLVYTFNLGQQRVKIKSLEKYNDGAWHNVIFIRDGNLGRLVIDGLTVLEDRAQGSNVSWHVSSHLYLGGVPPGRAQKNIQRNSAYSFTGCVKNLQLNGQWLSSVSQTFGVTPCFEGLSESGTYFSEEGGYVVLDDTFNLGLKFELVVEVRPRVASGVLLHVYTAAEEYLTIYIHQGAVVVLVNNGVREFFTQVTPRLGMCDGSWHRITVIRDANVVQLDVDSEVNHVVGPLNPSTQSARTPVFIGGAPESLLPEGIATRRAYTGCMRKLIVNESQVSFSKAALVSGAVSVGSCPAA